VRRRLGAKTQADHLNLGARAEAAESSVRDAGE